jgi:polyisoprenoid-binding protein YceI
MPLFKRAKLLFVLISLLWCHFYALSQAKSGIYTIANSISSFHSNAKLELIKAESSNLRGAIDVNKRTFAFSVYINTFDGFNGPLQKEHFNENYMETDRFPTATFTGRIVEEDNFTIDGTYNVRAKGKFTIHGIEQERIIQGDLVVKNGVMRLKCRFTVILNEHDIKIPRIVHEKLASEIVVEINAEFIKK